MKQVKVFVLDETGHSEATMAPSQAAQTVQQHVQSGRWAFADGQLMEGEITAERLENVSEVICTFPLVGGK